MNDIPNNDFTSDHDGSVRYPTDLTGDDFYDVPGSYGAADPYVNLAESGNMNTDHSTAPKTTELGPGQNVDKTQALQNALSRLEECQSNIATSELVKPTFEVVESTDGRTDIVESVEVTYENLIEKVDQAVFDQTVESTIETEMALEEICSDIADNWSGDSTEQSTGVQGPGTAVPVFVPGSVDPVFDIRDFVDVSNQALEPIACAYQTDPYCYDFNTPEEVKDRDFQKLEQQLSASEQSGLLEPANDDQLFVAKPGDVIQIDGTDGFDHIDLACFDSANASIDAESIVINDEEGTSFEIRFRNVDYVLFANEVRIDLTNL